MTLRHKTIACKADEIMATAYTIEDFVILAYNRQDAEETLSDYKAGRLEIETTKPTELPFE
jgi:hypothetical protein